MRIPLSPTPISLAIALVAGSLAAPAVAAQDQPPAKPAAAPAPAAPSRVGVEAFGGAAISWPTAKESFEAAGLDSKPLEFGGGGRVTGLWRSLFTQVAVSRWSDTGERSFIDSTGERFSLGIPLNVKTTFVDVTAGWKTAVRTERGRTAAWSYLGAGAGVAMYSESSPFAEPGDDVDTSAVSYHVLAGVEIPLLRWLAVAGEARYRYVPDVLGEDGISAALGDDSLGGVQTSIRLRVGFGPSQPRRTPGTPAAPKPPDAEPQPPSGALPSGLQVQAGVIIADAPVFVLPDATRTPLRTLRSGTAVQILEVTPEWIRVQFADQQFGPRVGYIQRKYVQVGRRDLP